MSDIECIHERVDHSEAISGKLPAISDPRTLQFVNYLKPAFGRPTLPEAHDWKPKVNEAQLRQGDFHVCRHGHTHYEWGTMGNISYNDCTVATAAHMIQAWTANANDYEVTVSDDEILAAYSGLTGYKPSEKTAKRSPGSSCLHALKYWQKHGIGDHQIDAYVALGRARRKEVKEAIYSFGAAYIGLLLPLTARQQPVWKYDKNGGPNAAANSWIGHAVPAVSYTPEELTVITWGKEKRMTWEFYEWYSDEAFGVLSGDWIDDSGVAPNFLELDALKADLEALKRRSHSKPD